jgi:Protein of unknown function (DUF2934)
MAKDTGKKLGQTATDEPHNAEEDIRRRAYELYEGRGREEGHELDDWLQAEQEITHLTRSIAA